MLPVVAGDGARSELFLQRPSGEPQELVYWLPAAGVPARHYQPLASCLAGHGLAVALHEWRGIGSSDRRAGRHSDWGYRELLDFDLPAGLAAAREATGLARAWLGGHSLGGQLAALYAGLHVQSVAGLVLVASGAPYWRCFPFGGLFYLACALAPWWARVYGYFPGRRLRLAGNEARSLIADWACSARSGRYAAAGMREDLERRLASLRLPVLGLRMRDDRLAPAASLAWLVGKMPLAEREEEELGPQQLGGEAGHFSWMLMPEPVAARIAHWIETRSGESQART